MILEFDSIGWERFYSLKKFCIGSDYKNYYDSKYRPKIVLSNHSHDNEWSEEKYKTHSEIGNYLKLFIFRFESRDESENFFRKRIAYERDGYRQDTISDDFHE